MSFRRRVEQRRKSLGFWSVGQKAAGEQGKILWSGVLGFQFWGLGAGRGNSEEFYVLAFKVEYSGLRILGAVRFGLEQ